MSYESPITIMRRQLANQINIQLEGKVLKAVMECNIDVNKDELIKALQYDREQYQKGYEDGKAEAMQWIPCSERLPNNDEYDWVLAQVQEDNGFMWLPKVMEYRQSKDDWYCDSEFGGWLKERHGDAFKVIAWMPLPEPYEKEVADRVGGDRA